jgi:uncharacterized protein YndB with AHSA1/START domain
MTKDTDLVLERTLNAPRDLVWKALTTPEHLKKWWAPRPYETTEVEMDLKPGGKFRTRMIGPDDFDSGEKGEGCFLEVVEGEKLVWTSALAGGWRPNAPDGEECGGLIFTAVMSFSDAGDGKTHYHILAMHTTPEGAKTHADMGFHEGWGTCADQLGEVAASLKN